MPILFQDSDRSFLLQTPRSTMRLRFIRNSTFRFTSSGVGKSTRQTWAICGHQIGWLFRQVPWARRKRVARSSSSRVADFRARRFPRIRSDGWATGRFTAAGAALQRASHPFRQPALSGLPATYVESDDQADTLDIDLADELTGVRVTLSYTDYRDFDAIARSMRIHNGGRHAVQLLNAASASVDLHNHPLDVIHLPGGWARERHIYRQRVAPGGRFATESRRSTSSHQQHPFLALLDPDAGETFGEVFGFSLVYSGNFSASVKADQFSRPRIRSVSILTNFPGISNPARLSELRKPCWCIPRKVWAECCALSRSFTAMFPLSNSHFAWLS
jgi:hypothetical protein